MQGLEFFSHKYSFFVDRHSIWFYPQHILQFLQLQVSFLSCLSWILLYIIRNILSLSYLCTSFQASLPVMKCFCYIVLPTHCPISCILSLYDCVVFVYCTIRGHSYKLEFFCATLYPYIISIQFIIDYSFKNWLSIAHHQISKYQQGQSSSFYYACTVECRPCD